MDKASFLRMQWFTQNFLQADRHYSVLDVGSYDVNGTYKEIFESSQFTYTGLDMEAGPNVTLVPVNPYVWKEIQDDSYDVVISGQVLEHSEFFWLTVGEMTRVLRPGGLMCIIVPRGFHRHRHPVDCYRFDVDGMVAIARYCNLEPLHASTNRAPSQELADWYSSKNQLSMLIAKKTDNWNGMLDIEHYKFSMPDIEALATGMLEMEKQEKEGWWSKTTHRWKRSLKKRIDRYILGKSR